MGRNNSETYTVLVGLSLLKQKSSITSYDTTNHIILML